MVLWLASQESARWKIVDGVLPVVGAVYDPTSRVSRGNGLITAAGRLLVFNCYNYQEVFVWRQEAVTSRPSLAQGVARIMMPRAGNKGHTAWMQGSMVLGTVYR